jgi:tetratricopeptide (TPR) repeat protein
MAPEILLGLVETASIETDIYSLGVTLYEWLTREHPYIDPKTGNYQQKYRRLPVGKLILRHGLKILSVVSLIDLALQLDPRTRPSSYDELIRKSRLPLRQLTDLENEVDDIVARCAYLRKRRRAEEAYKILKKALIARPSNPILLNAFGILLHSMGRNDDGNDCYSSAYEYLKLSEGKHRGHLYLDPIINLGAKYISADKFYDAAKVLEQCARWTAINKGDGAFYVELGWLYLWDAHYELACDYISAYYETNRPDSVSLLWLTHAEYMSGRLVSKADQIAKLITSVQSINPSLALASCLVANFASEPYRSVLSDAAYKGYCFELDATAEYIGTESHNLRPPLSNRSVARLASALDELVTGGKFFDNI